MREYEEALCKQAAALLPAGCQVILLADRGCATVQFFRFLDGLGWDGVIRSKGHVLVRWKGAWIPLALLGKGRPARFNTLILDNTRTTRPGASLGTISRARGLWPGRFSLSCPALRI